MTQESKKSGANREKARSELEREGARKVRNLADKAKEKAEKKLRDRKTR